MSKTIEEASEEHALKDMGLLVKESVTNKAGIHCFYQDIIVSNIEAKCSFKAGYKFSLEHIASLEAQVKVLELNVELKNDKN